MFQVVSQFVITTICEFRRYVVEIELLRQSALETIQDQRCRRDSVSPSERLINQRLRDMLRDGSAIRLVEHFLTVSFDQHRSARSAKRIARATRKKFLARHAASERTVSPMLRVVCHVVTSLLLDSARETNYGGRQLAAAKARLGSNSRLVGTPNLQRDPSFGRDRVTMEPKTRLAENCQE